MHNAVTNLIDFPSHTHVLPPNTGGFTNWQPSDTWQPNTTEGDPNGTITVPNTTGYPYPAAPDLPMLDPIPDIQIYPTPTQIDGDIMFVPKNPEERRKMIMKLLDEAKWPEIPKAVEKEHERGRLIERPDEETE